MHTRIFATVLFLVFSLTLVAQEEPSSAYQEKYDKMMERTQWWRNDRFGMFIHWGAYAVAARGEWVKSNERMTTAEYQPRVEAFKPDLYDPEKWAKTAKAAGMKYAVITAKHHDGFCLFDSKYTDYKISTYMPGRDLIKEFVEAFRNEGLKVGFYYSLIDWHHKDYPNVGNHPMRGNEKWSEKEYDWDNYLKYMHNQVEELVTHYGKIDILWLDYSFGDYKGEKWKAETLVNMVRNHQPEIILNNRLVINEGVSSKAREFKGYGDFETPEQGIPEEGLQDTYGNPIPWETCLTLNNNWGYHKTDNQWKSAEKIIHALVNCVSKNGNLLLNVGPDARGRIPEESVKTLKAVGKWMDTNGKSVYGCGKSALDNPEWGYTTQNGNKLYLHWAHPTIGPLNLKGYADKTRQAILLHDGSEAATTERWWGNQGNNNFFVNIANPIHYTYQLPDPHNTVIQLLLKE